MKQLQIRPSNVGFLCWLVFAGWASASATADGTWLAVETAHFTLMTDADQQKGEEIASHLERFRATFARLSPSLELRSPAPMSLFAFRDADSFAPYKSRSDRPGARILGQFIRHRDSNFLTIDASSQLADSMSVIFHEYVHYLVTHNLPGVPLWFNEGLAEYYSTFAVENGRVVVGRPIERHVKWLNHRADFSLSELLAADSQSAASHGASEVGSFYAMSWALAHYLMSDSERIDQCLYYFDLVAQGEEPDDAFEEAFDARLGTLEEALRAYVARGDFASASWKVPGRSSVTRVRRLQPAQILVELGDLLSLLGRPEQAEDRYLAALQRQPEEANAHTGLAWVRVQQNRWQEAEILFQDGHQLGADRALGHVLYARHSIQLAGSAAQQKNKGAAERARRSLRRALAVMPSYGEAYGLMASAQLLDGGEPAAALASVEQALELLPGRLDLIWLKIRTLLRLERVDAAEDVLTLEFEPFTQDLDLVQQAWEEVDRTRLLLAAQAAFEEGMNEEGLALFDEAISLTSDEDLRQRMERQLLDLQRQAGR